MEYALGAWSNDEGHLILDGGSEGPMDEEHDKRHIKRKKIYAHELTHSFDCIQGDGIEAAKQIRISDSLEWKEAYREEIKKGTIPLSLRANHSPREGFAELGKFLYSGRNMAKNKAESEQLYPKCHAIFEKYGLIMQNENLKMKIHKTKTLDWDTNMKKGKKRSWKNWRRNEALIQAVQQTRRFIDGYFRWWR